MIFNVANLDAYSKAQKGVSSVKGVSELNWWQAVSRIFRHGQLQAAPRVVHLDISADIRIESSRRAGKTAAFEALYGRTSNLNISSNPNIAWDDFWDYPREPNLVKSKLSKTLFEKSQMDDILKGTLLHTTEHNIQTITSSAWNIQGLPKAHVEKEMEKMEQARSFTNFNPDPVRKRK